MWTFTVLECVIYERTDVFTRKFLKFWVRFYLVTIKEKIEEAVNF
jgi:hypothetical protein